MDIDSVKKAIDFINWKIDASTEGSPERKHYETLRDLASLVVSAPVVNEEMCIVSTESLHEPSRRRGLNQAIQADRLLWSKVILRLPEIIQDGIIRFCAVDKWYKITQFERDMAKFISDAIKNELNITQPKG